MKYICLALRYLLVVAWGGARLRTSSYKSRRDTYSQTQNEGQTVSCQEGNGKSLIVLRTFTPSNRKLLRRRLIKSKTQ